MNGVGESSVVLVPAVHRPFGATAKLSPLKGFSTSPPERIGVRGEYDYNGLAKRVLKCFNQSIQEDISRLKIRQRGCVVILTGAVSSRTLLNELVTLATSVEGTALVEIYRMQFIEEGATAQSFTTQGFAEGFTA
ncbi:phospholipid-binding protein [cf. Phormidesmis sp. LEGE 11477]|uniref:phospholipid-binding protein n=1 Tax=cf. Phormidesmis sp. LEGE 11477 TaxID=1828680 RepID=UPI001880CA29|nr:phospholipid-binding protein [cf. Phormidesmis sp. LEGE 11477]MBE9062783.1 phospholipid-binding protein [cf. Phormidesmis sp. LEGE 11477]